MREFKIGDKVRCVRLPNVWYYPTNPILNEVYIITSFDIRGFYLTGKTSRYDNHESCFFHKEYFELVTNTPTLIKRANLGLNALKELINNDMCFFKINGIEFVTEEIFENIINSIESFEEVG